MKKMDKEDIKTIGQFVLLATETVSETQQKVAELSDTNTELRTKLQTLLSEKEALQKQAEEGAKPKPYATESTIRQTVENMQKAGFIDQSKTAEAIEDIKNRPEVVLSMMDVIAQREVGQGMYPIGTVDSDKQASTVPMRESDRFWNERYG